MASKTMTKTNADPMIRAVRVDDEGCVSLLDVVVATSDVKFGFATR